MPALGAASGGGRAPATRLLLLLLATLTVAVLVTQVGLVSSSNKMRSLLALACLLIRAGGLQEPALG